MVRIGISVEGPTEERFVQLLLVPYFSSKNIYITPVSMGGDIKIARVKNEIEKLAYSFDYVTTLYDFYGFKGLEATDNKQSVEQKILNSLKEEIKDKCIPYIQMYEFEGLLFSAPSKRFESDTPYKKTMDGPDIAVEAGLPAIRCLCTGFNAWIEQIEDLPT